MPNAYIYDAIRTPRGRGKQNGSLHSVKPISLIRGLITEIQKRNPGVDPHDIEDVVLGVVSPIGDQGSAIAKTAALAAGSARLGGARGGAAGAVRECVRGACFAGRHGGAWRAL
jgi:acetyl-CoA acetyltransferase